jgi:hypothetical protein
VSHLAPLSEEEVNRLLGMVVDVENIFMSMHREEDADTKRVYYYLFKVYSIIYVLFKFKYNAEIAVALQPSSICEANQFIAKLRKCSSELTFVYLILLSLSSEAVYPLFNPEDEG